ncbi:hypothetical protein N9E88_04625 [Gammaproteobacteria bacterium]|nr:hypothetical protein [Gammaproteobacteria bacterium]MDA9834355.1 hypothetical protein [Gammaproteobacteria bacterium]MDA9979530.1 hypothetical protein [Gammaproteobacteria bacterium]MDC3371623.1 hypothetical protein [Gammaproteobacteria bacterium]
MFNKRLIHESVLNKYSEMVLDVSVIKITILFILSTLSSNIFSEVYFCNYKGGHLGVQEGKVIIKKLDTGVLVKYEVSERMFNVVKEDNEMLVFNYVNHWTDMKGRKEFSTIDLRMINKKENIYTHYILSDKSSEFPIEYGVTMYDGKCLKDE